MYKARLFAARHARFYEALYNASSPIILSLLRGVNMLTRDKLDRPITWVEKRLRGLCLTVKCVAIVSYQLQV